MDLDNRNSQWTYEYTISFFLGPIVGALAAGVCFNILRETSVQMKAFELKQEAVKDKGIGERKQKTD